MQAQIAQAERIRHHQQQNIKNLFECDKKQIDDEYRVHLLTSCITGSACVSP